MRPYPGRNLSKEHRILNYRFSHARRTIENAFGVLTAKWRLLHKPIIGERENIMKIVKAMCVLHNIVKTKELAIYTPAGYVDNGDNENGQWRAQGHQLEDIGHQGARNSNVDAITMRNEYCRYFNSENGRLSWQDDYINRLQ